MLVFSEGVPRSGKSYDAVKNHILPALKKGRKVYARLNGLNHERIAAHLGKSEDEIRANLVSIDTNEVVETFKAQQDESGKWTIPDAFKNALVVIDEVHEFYVGGTREPLAPASEQFFALHGHYGMDVLTMTQFYKRVHTAIRYRIERKNVFQKLSALGKKGEGLYRETAYQTVAPDKYEKTGAQTRPYDKDVWPLYHGIVDGGESGVEQEVYGGGRVTIWKTLLIPSLIVLPLGAFAIWYLLHFFSGGGKDLVKTTKIQTTAHVDPNPAIMSPGTVYQPGATRAAVPVAPIKTDKEKHVEAMTPEQRYVWELSEKGRVRFTGAGFFGPRVVGFVEWYDGSFNLLDRLSLDQLATMGIATAVDSYGVKLSALGESIIATAWPVVVPVRENAPRLYNTGGDGAVAMSEANADMPSSGVGSVESPAVASLPSASSGAFRR